MHKSTLSIAVATAAPRITLTGARTPAAANAGRFEPDLCAVPGTRPSGTTSENSRPSASASRAR